MIIKRRKWSLFEHMKIKDETENIRAVAEIKMEGQRHRGRPRLRWIEFQQVRFTYMNK